MEINDLEKLSAAKLADFDKQLKSADLPQLVKIAYEVVHTNTMLNEYAAGIANRANDVQKALSDYCHKIEAELKRAQENLQENLQSEV
jgi:hypothetical protein